jgi:plastocyanin
MPRVAKALLAAAAPLVLLAAPPASAQDATTLQLSIKNNRFEPAEIKAPAGKPLTLKVKNLDATPEEFESKTLRVEKIIAGNGEATIQLRALQPGRYKFFGEYHESTAQGVLVVE